MKTLWIGAVALMISTAVYAGVAGTIVDQPKFATLAMLYKLSSPETLISAAKPLETGILAQYVHLHNTRLESSPHLWLAGGERH